jgi:putative endonuclease
MVLEGRKYYTTYILYSPCRDEYYVGHTQDAQERLERYHNIGKSLYTKRGIPWSLVYSELFETRSQAMRREREIKSKKSRNYIKRLIQSVPSRS